MLAPRPRQQSEQDRLARGGGRPGVGGPERAAAPGPLGRALPSAVGRQRGPEVENQGALELLAAKLLC